MNYVITEKLPQFGENTYKEIPIPDSLVKQIRTDAIDEFAKGIAKECGNKPYYNDLCLCLARIFEQLKEQKQ